MKIKLIAVDMDGTFLNEKKDYDRERFQRQYHALKEKGIKFVVASGNQYYQLISFFPEICHDIAFIAENGALVYDQGQRVHHGELTTAQFHNVVDELGKFDGINFVVCGLESAYYRTGAPQAFIDLMSKHYHRLKPVDDLYAIDDVIFKFSLNLHDDAIPALVDSLHHSLDGIVKPVTSGFGFVDLIIPGSHKASGLQRLMARWDINPGECVAVGDSGNDIEMLQLAGYSFAMDNAAPEVKKIAKYATGSLNHSGALEVIDAVLEQRLPA